MANDTQNAAAESEAPLNRLWSFSTASSNSEGDLESSSVVSELVSPSERVEWGRESCWEGRQKVARGATREIGAYHAKPPLSLDFRLLMV